MTVRAGTGRPDVLVIDGDVGGLSVALALTRKG